ncbi:MAG: PHP domain-containing protein [Candidatus Poseidoniaceae archaeon]
MWCSDVDLHSHSTHSDGTLDVATLAANMAREGVRVWSLTDHDTTSGWEEAAVEAERHGMAFLPGVELTCMPALVPSSDAKREGSWHLLAYFPGPLDAPKMRDVRAWISGLTEARGPRMSLMIERLASFGIDVNESNVLARADGAVGRPHLAAELLDMGVVDTFQQAFDDWIGDGAPANVERPRPTLEEASAHVHAAGGFCSLAHPVYYGVDTADVLDLLCELGIEAVEAFHGGHTDAYRDEVWRAAVERGLSVTAGSDHHGPEHHPRPGHRPVPIADVPEAVRRLREHARTTGQS